MRWNPADYRSDPRVRLLTHRQDLLYRRCLEDCHLGGGRLSRDPEKIRRLVDWPAEWWDEDWGEVSRFFEPHPEAPEKYLANKRVLEDLEELSASSRMRQSKRRGGAARAGRATRDKSGRFVRLAPDKSAENARSAPATHPAQPARAGRSAGRASSTTSTCWTPAGTSTIQHYGDPDPDLEKAYRTPSESSCAADGTEGTKARTRRSTPPDFRKLRGRIGADDPRLPDACREFLRIWRSEPCARNSSPREVAVAWRAAVEAAGGEGEILEDVRKRVRSAPWLADPSVKPLETTYLRGRHWERPIIDRPPPRREAPPDRSLDRMDYSKSFDDVGGEA